MALSATAEPAPADIASGDPACAFPAAGCPAITGIGGDALPTTGSTSSGTGAAISVELPFAPGYVWACKTAGTGAPVQAVKHPGLPDDDCIKTVAAGTTTVDTAGLITLGASGGGKGFQIGTDTDLNENAQPIRYLALGFNDNGFQ